MKKYYKLITMAVCLIGSLSFVSCNDDDDENEWNATYVYLERTDYLAKPKTFNLTHERSGEIGGDEITMTFTAKTQKPVSSDVTVELEIASGNDAFKVDQIKINSSKAVIKAGQQVSEVITIDVDRSIFSSIEDKINYAFSVSISKMTTNNGNTFVSENLKTLHATINKPTYLNLEQGIPDNSQLWKANTEWSFVFQDGVENSDNNALIGNSGNDVATNGVPFWFTVDLNEVKTVNGIQTKHWGKDYAPTQVEVFRSENGSTWKSMGVLDISGGTQNIAFIKPIQTRYLKYQMLEVPDRVDITGFSVYIPE